MNTSKLLSQKIYIQVANSLGFEVSTTTDVTMVVGYVSCRTIVSKIQRNPTDTLL